MFKLILTIAILFTIISLLSAVALARPRVQGAGRGRPPAADPFRYPFGDVPTVMPGFTRERLEEIARRPVELHHESYSARTAGRADQGSGGDGKSSQGAAAARPFLFLVPDRQFTREELDQIRDRWEAMHAR